MPCYTKLLCSNLRFRLNQRERSKIYIFEQLFDNFFKEKRILCRAEKRVWNCIEPKIRLSLMLSLSKSRRGCSFNPYFTFPNVIGFVSSQDWRSMFNVFEYITPTVINWPFDFEQKFRKIEKSKNFMFLFFSLPSLFNLHWE